MGVTEALVTVRLPAAPTAPLQVEIMNEPGQVVNAFTMNAAVAEINMSNYEGGVYFVRLIKGSEVSIHRVVKQ